jgi:two-component system sensor histidine kinase BaeS
MRVAVSTPQGEWLSGRPPRPGTTVLQQPVTVDGIIVAVAWMEALPPAPQSLDAAFLTRQYRGILWAAAGLLLLAVLGAVWVGRRWLRPVQEARQAAHRIADGELHTRLTPCGSDELAGLAHDINAMAASLQQLEASRRRWIAELSHETRTPLAVLRGEVEALIDGVRPLDHQALASLQGEVARLTRLMDDFHQLALSDLRALPCHFGALDAGALVREAAARAAPHAAAAGLTLDWAVPAEPVRADWDRQRIEQLLTNLMQNSLRYTDAPGRLSLTLQAADDLSATLVVEDSAPGVPTDALTRLFEPLYRADPSRSRQSGGSGLGLAICQAIVRSHGGSIVAQPSAWGGLRVEACLPLHPGASA